MNIRAGVVAALIVLVAAVSAHGQVKPDVSKLDIESLRDAAVRPLTACYAGAIGCAQTRTGRVSVDSCHSDGLYAVGYSFEGTAGRRITITGQSIEFAATILLADGRSGNTTIYARHDVFTDGAIAAIRDFVLPYTGTYLILITPGVRYEFGDYTLTVSCPTSSASCTPSTTAACLLDGRFRVSINYINQFSNPPNQAGTFLAARLLQGVQNPDTALFGFSNPQAVEVVVRIQDTRPFAPRFDIYYGGMTDVAYTVHVTDTRSGVSRQYVNPAGKVGGGVDRTSFPAN